MKSKMPRGRPRQFNPDTALDKALNLFWRHGYEGTSIAMLAAEIDVNVPSLYAAFGSKEKLFLKAVERYGEANGRMYHESFKHKTSREVAEAILLGEVELVTRPGTPDGCLVMLGAVITSPDSENIRQFMAGLRAMAEGWMADRFKRARKEGDLPPEADPATLACYIMTLNSGLAAQAKSGVPRKKLIQVVHAAMANWPQPRSLPKQPR